MGQNPGTVLILGEQFNKIGSDSDQTDPVKGTTGREGGPHAYQHRFARRLDIKYPNRVETGRHKELALYLDEIFREYPRKRPGSKPVFGALTSTR